MRFNNCYYSREEPISLEVLNSTEKITPALLDSDITSNHNRCKNMVEIRLRLPIVAMCICTSTKHVPTDEHVYLLGEKPPANPHREKRLKI